MPSYVILRLGIPNGVSNMDLTINRHFFVQSYFSFQSFFGSESCLFMDDFMPASGESSLLQVIEVERIIIL